MLRWIKRRLIAAELERLQQEYDDQAGRHHDRYQGLLDKYNALKQEQDERLSEVLSFLEALEFNKTRGAAALREQRDALLDKVRKQG